MKKEQAPRRHRGEAAQVAVHPRDSLSKRRSDRSRAWGPPPRRLTHPPCSSAYDARLRQKVAVKKLSRPFQSLIHARRTYRELRLLKHLKHENVSGARGWSAGGRGSPRGTRHPGGAPAGTPSPDSRPHAGHWAAGRVHAGHLHRGLQRSVSGSPRATAGERVPRGGGGASVLTRPSSQVPGDHPDGRRPEQHRQVPGAERRARPVPGLPVASRAEGGRRAGGPRARCGGQNLTLPPSPPLPSQYIHSAGIIHRVGAAAG